MRWLINLVGAIVSRFVELDHVLSIVLSNSKNVTAAEGRKKDLHLANGWIL